MYWFNKALLTIVNPKKPTLTAPQAMATVRFIPGIADKIAAAVKNNNPVIMNILVKKCFRMINVSRLVLASLQFLG